MWNRSSKIQRRVRTAAGGLVLAFGLSLPWFTSGVTHPSVAAQRIGHSALALVSPDELRWRVDTAGAMPSLFDGTEVYIREPDGRGLIIGRAVREDDEFYVILPPDAASRYSEGAVLLYDRAPRRIDQAIALILAPDGSESEMQRAREALMPVVRRELIKPMEDRFQREFAKFLAELPRREKEQIDQLGQDVYTELSPDIEDLTDRLVGRAWSEIGVWGVTEGVARKLSGAAKDVYGDVKDSIFGSDSDNEKPTSFLSDERKEELRRAMEAELSEYWKENGDDILKRSSKVFSKYQGGFIDKIKQEWLPAIYETVLVEVWRENHMRLFRALSDYASDFTSRRLKTSQGGPQLALGYSIRAMAFYNSRPLLVVQAQPGAEPGVLKLVPYSEGLR